MTEIGERDTIVNHKGFRDYILFICVGVCILLYAYSHWKGFSNPDIAVLGYVTICASSIALLILNWLWSPFSFNGKSFDYHFKKICRKSKVIREIRELNERTFSQIDEIAIELEKTYPSLTENEKAFFRRYVRSALT